MMKLALAALLLLLCLAGSPASAEELDLAGMQRARELGRELAALVAEGNLADAEKTGEELLELRRKLHGDASLDVARTLRNLAVLASSRGSPAVAAERTERALEILRGIADPADPAIWSALVELSGHEVDSGRPREAEVHAREALELAEGTPEGPSGRVATACNQLARALQTRGDFAAARPIYERALALLEEAGEGDGADGAVLRQNLAHLLAAQGDLESALPLLERALRIAEKTAGSGHPATALARNNLAYLLQDLGDAAGAREHFEESLKIWEEAMGAENPELAVPLTNLATLLQTLGEIGPAREHLERAVALLEKGLGPGHPRLAAALSSMAMLELESGNTAPARKLLERSLDIRRTAFGELHPDVARTRHRLARVLERSSATREARVQASAALEAQTGILDLLMPALSEPERLAFLDASRRYLDHFVSLHDASGDSSRVYDKVLAWKGLAWRTLLASRAAGAVSTDPAVTTLQSQYDECRRELAVTFLHEPATAPEAASRRKGLDALTEQKERLERELTARGAAAHRPSPPVTAAELLASLGTGVGLVDYLVYQRSDASSPEATASLVAFAARSGTIRPVRVELGPLSAVEEAVGAWFPALSTKVGDPRIARRLAEKEKRAGPAVSERVWEPVERAVPMPDTVVVCPDGPVCRIPFSALPGPADPDSRLLDFHTFATVTSAADLVPLTAVASRAHTTGLALLGGVIYDQAPEERTGAPGLRSATAPPDLAAARKIQRGPSSSSAFEFLPGTRDEVRSILQLYEDTGQIRADATMLEGTGATKAALFSAVRQKRWVHLATHGYWNEAGVEAATLARGTMESGERPPRGLARNPLLFAGLALSAANLGPAGILSGEEAATLPLSGAELVTISACESGLGVVRSGEGVLGLRRALLAAGAGTVLTALWQVPDESTRQLMELLYRELWSSGREPVQALAAAQRKWLEAARREGSDTSPVYWAGFVATIGR